MSLVEKGATLCERASCEVSEAGGGLGLLQVVIEGDTNEATYSNHF